MIELPIVVILIQNEVLLTEDKLNQGMRCQLVISLHLIICSQSKSSRIYLILLKASKSFNYHLNAGIEYSINTAKNLLEWHYRNGLTILDFFYQKWAKK